MKTFNILFLIAASLNLVCLAIALPLSKATLNSKVQDAVEPVRADLHFIDQLFEKIYKTDISLGRIGEPESRHYLAEGIADYMDTISGGGPNRLVRVEGDAPESKYRKRDMDEGIFRKWYTWSVAGVCKRFVDALELITDLYDNDYDLHGGANRTTLQLFIQMRGCRNILQSNPIDESFEFMKAKHGDENDEVVLVLP